MKDIYFSPQPQEIPFEDIYSDSSMTPQNGEEEPKKKKKKKHRFLKWVLKVSVSLFLFLSLIISGMALVSGYSRVNLSNNKYISNSELKSSPFVTNILLIGADASDGGNSRSDSMILVSIDYAHFKIKLTSVLRDSQVTSPVRNKQIKLNSAYSSGGAQELIDTLEYNFRVNIHHFIKVDFEMFTQLIDKLGGIDIEVTEKEARFINRTTRHTISSGDSVHLDGAKALVYARIRKLDSDYMRTFRQRKVITAIIDKMKSQPITEIVRIVTSVLPLLETDLNCFEVTGLAYKGGFAALLFKIESLRIPDDGDMTTGYLGSQWVVKPNMEACREKIKDFIY